MDLNRLQLDLIISPNEVFGNIMVLASLQRPPPPPVDPDDVNARKILEKYLTDLFQILSEVHCY